MYKIDPEKDLALAEEFRRNPIGHHSPNLQRILNILRHDLSGNQIILVTRIPFRDWVIGRMPPRRSDPIVIDDRSIVYTTKEDAEWAVFCHRWEAATGHALSRSRSISVLKEQSC